MGMKEKKETKKSSDISQPLLADADINQREREELEVQAEDEYYDLLDTVDEELAERWVGEIEEQMKSQNTGFIDALEKLKQKIEARKAAKEMLDGGKIVQDILRSKRFENFQGNGSVAEVYDLDYADGLCVKIIFNQDRYREGNTVHQEADIMRDLANFVVEEVRSPEVVNVISGGDIVAIIMEKMKMVTFAQVREGLREMPEKFDYDDYFRRVDAYIDSMHNDKKIYHGDLRSRNMGIEIDTGLPIIFDFGKSKKIEFDSDLKLEDEYDATGLQEAKKKARQLVEALEKGDLSELN